MRFYLICQLTLALLLLPLSGTAQACADQLDASQVIMGAEADKSDDCCDTANACVADCCDKECPPGCGHCLAQSHGCSIPGFSILMTPIIAASELVAFLASKYDHIGPTPTPPPNIA